MKLGTILITIGLCIIILPTAIAKVTEWIIQLASDDDDTDFIFMVLGTEAYILPWLFIIPGIFLCIWQKMKSRKAHSKE